MTRTERLLRLARQRGDRAAELIVEGKGKYTITIRNTHLDRWANWTEAELREAWGR